MEQMRTFHGKSLDEAIRNACEFFDAERSKLEIDIIEDAKAGLFGIVGAREATIKARLVGTDAAGEAFLTAKDFMLNIRDEEKVPAEKPTRKFRPKREPAAKEAASKDEAGTPDRTQEEPSDREEASVDSQDGRAPRSGQRQRRERQPKREPRERRPRKEHEQRPPRDDDGEPSIPFEELDQDRLVALTADAAKMIVGSILGEVPVTASVADSRVNVAVGCGEDSGLLIGREGQTLASVQYLLSRMVSARMGASIRVQVDAGDYRERQDERLKELAQVLAERVRMTGRACSTRPLSAYHRRIIHVALQDEADIQTRSSGEGAMKRVIVQKRKVSQESPVQVEAPVEVPTAPVEA